MGEVVGYPRRRGVRFRRHALERMRERGINKKTVLEVIAAPDTWKSGSDPELDVFSKRLDDGRVIDVAFKYRGGYLVVVTAILKRGEHAIGLGGR